MRSSAAQRSRRYRAAQKAVRREDLEKSYSSFLQAHNRSSNRSNNPEHAFRSDCESNSLAGPSFQRQTTERHGSASPARDMSPSAPPPRNLIDSPEVSPKPPRHYPAYSMEEIDDEDAPPPPAQGAPPVGPRTSESRNTPQNDVDDPIGAGSIPDAGLDSAIPDIQTMAQFIDILKSATLEGSNMCPEDIDRLRNPPSTIPGNLDDKDVKLSLDMFFATTLASRETYDDVCAGIKEHSPHINLLSFHEAKRLIEELTGVVPIYHDMCPDSCIAYTGPYEKLDQCPVCTTPRRKPDPKLPHKQIPRRQFTTIPIGPVIQTLYRSEEGADRMKHRARRTQEILDHMERNDNTIECYDDVYCGTDYLNAVREGRIKESDVALQFSIDGAQLFRNKKSDCWIYIWVIHNLAPDLRYKKSFVIPGGFVPGPGKPKNVDSFVFPGLYHVCALDDGLDIWDAQLQRYLKITLFIIFGSADGPAMAALAGMVGHTGKYGCRLYCAIQGRHRKGGGHYHPIMLKPLAYMVQGCSHDDVTPADLRHFRSDIKTRYVANLARLVKAPNITQYHAIRLVTGLTKPTLFGSLTHCLGIPNIFVLDLMHLVALNDTELLLGLWRGTLKCYGRDKHSDWEWLVLGPGVVWEAHGKAIALATSYLPSSFDRAPRNPAEKINSGYKAWEYLLWLFGLGPALLRHVLPEAHWVNYCRLVRGYRLLSQHKIVAQDLVEGNRHLLTFAFEFEQLYYQRNEDRIHLVRPSIHLLTHIGPETVRAGPLSCYAQWTMENVIGNLGNEIRSDVDPYTNIANRGVQRAQHNCILSMFPGVFKDKTRKPDPHGSLALGDNFLLLRPCDHVLRDIPPSESDALQAFWMKQEWPNWENWPRAIKKWGRLRLPNGQTARSKWTEAQSRRELRQTRMVKLLYASTDRIAEVYYYFRLKFGSLVYTLALVSLFSPPDTTLLEKSLNTVSLCHYLGDENLLVCDIKDIKSVVAMVPDYKLQADGSVSSDGLDFFLVEKPGLELAFYQPCIEEDEEGDEIQDTFS